ncbi:MAG: GGDEF domain-containing protein [Lachnospiraceae bacterium]|nr:GGDEF domain-containing protein [Lachnospiraceae bacterium]
MEDSRYQKLHKHFLIIMLIVTVMILVLLVLQYYMLIKVDARYADITREQYMKTYVLIPCVIFTASYIVVWQMLDSPNIQSQWKDFATILFVWVLCTVGCFVGAESPVLYGSFAVPISLSSIYGRRWMCRTTEGLCLVTVVQYIGTAQLLPTCGDNTIVDVIFGFVLLMLCIICNEILMAYVMDNNGVILSHVSDNTRLEMRLQRDPMTGLYNHTAFYEYLDTFVRNRGEAPLTLAVVDIDDFKKVNDTYGHNMGDEVILNLSRVLQKWCGEDNYVCRYGGEEFSVIFPNVKVRDAAAMMNNALGEFRETEYEWLDGRITFSCGIFQMSSYTMTAEEFFKVADKMLYNAKHNGKNQCVSG